MTKQDLKDKYLNQKGFVFIGAVPSMEDSVKGMVNQFIGKLTTEQPEIIVGFEDGKEYVIIYKDHSDFDLPMLFQYVDDFVMRMRFGNLFRFTTLREYLN
jgi:hypothetical protein